MDRVKEFVKKSLPKLSDDLLHSVLGKMEDCGVEEYEDLKYVKPDDFEGILKSIQARKLEESIKAAFVCGYQDVVLPAVNSVQLEHSGPQVEVLPSVEESGRPVFSVNSSQNCETVFAIPYKKFPPLVLATLEAQGIPSPGERREIIRIIAAEIMQHYPKPQKKHVEPIASDLVNRYPVAFRDTLNGQNIGKGYSSILNQLIARVENVSRATGSSVKRALQSFHPDASDRKKRLSDSYGCVNYQPASLPQDESEASQLEKNDWLKQEFPKVLQNANKVEEYMHMTYYSQRLCINVRSPIKIVKSDWPFLSERKHFFRHADSLMGFCVKERLEAAVAEKIPQLVAYFNSPECKIFNKSNLPAHISYLKLLSTYFGEEEKHMIHVFEGTTSLKDVMVMDNCPVTPFIASLGDPYEQDPVCTVVLEKEHLEEMIPLSDALAMWFSCYYVFNMQYPVSCAATLEFIQRVFLNINPERGTKMAKRQGKRSGYIHPKVLNLINKLTNFNSLWKL